MREIFYDGAIHYQSLICGNISGMNVSFPFQQLHLHGDNFLMIPWGVDPQEHTVLQLALMRDNEDIEQSN